MISEILISIFNSTETAFFVVLIIGVTIYLGHFKYTRFSITHGPEILTTLGILGCFLGIALGLLNFDSGNVQLSIPALLTGVKTAFWSSIAGVFGALYLKWRHYTKKIPTVENNGEMKAASIEDIVSVMQSLKNGLVGDEQGTLLSQMKLQRQESSDKMDSLISEFKNFASHMVENNQKAIIEALKEVIKDFNEKLTEQFGENFKNLNAAVEKLVIWQQQYKEELDLLQNSQKQTADDLNTVAKSFTLLVKQAERFTEISSNLHTQLELMEVQKQTLYEQQISLSEVLKTMKDVTPQFSTKVDAMIQDINQGLNTIQTEITTSVNGFSAHVQSSNAEMKTLLTETIKKSQEDLSASLNEQIKTVKEGVITLDTVMQKELNSAIESMGRQLASLSSKFVEDYSPLTDRLREIVQLSKKV
jgi:hypothetical protein